MSPRFLPVSLASLALATTAAWFAPTPAQADPCHHKPAVEKCLRQGGDLLTCSCLNGGPCDGALFTIACGHGCDELGRFDGNNTPVDISIDFFDGAGKLLYRDDGAFAIARDGHDGGVVVMATGNLERIEFEQWFHGPKAPLAETAGLTLKVYNEDAKGKRRLVVAGPNVVYAHALYADRCGSVAVPKGQLTPEDESARAIAAEAALQAQITQEIADRAAGDASLDGQLQQLSADLHAEVLRASGVEQQLLQDLSVKLGDFQTRQSALELALSDEAAARKLGDRDTLAAANLYADNALAAEITRAQNAETSLLTTINQVSSSLNAEAARAQSAESTLTASVAGVNNALSAEVTRAQAAEASMLAGLGQAGADLASEVARAKSTEALIYNTVNGVANTVAIETANRESADNALINAITGVQNNLALHQFTLGSPGVPNNPANPVDWGQIKNIPPGLLLGGAGIVSLNNSSSPNQTLSVGNAGLSPGWSTAGGVHTLNLPIASPSATGVINGGSNLFVQNQSAAAQAASFYIASADLVRTARVENTAGAGYAFQAVNTTAAGLGGGGGIFGDTSQYWGVGIHGHHGHPSGTGVYGAGQGMYGVSLATGSGGAFSGYDTGLFAYASTPSVGQAIYTNLDGFVTRVNYWSGTIQYKIQGVGTVSTLVKDTNERTVVMHAPETPEIYLQDFGQAQLVNGRAHVELDPAFAKNVTISPRHPMRVFIQLEDNEDIRGVVVKNKTDHGFDVVELGGGRSNTPFQWQITCNRADEDFGNGRVSRNADARFEPAADAIPQIAPGGSGDAPRTGATPSSGPPASASASSTGGVLGRVLSAIAPR